MSSFSSELNANTCVRLQTVVHTDSVFGTLLEFVLPWEGDDERSSRSLRVSGRQMSGVSRSVTPLVQHVPTPTLTGRLRATAGASRSVVTPISKPQSTPVYTSHPESFRRSGVVVVPESYPVTERDRSLSFSRPTVSSAGSRDSAGPRGGVEKDRSLWVRDNHIPPTIETSSRGPGI